MMYSEKYNYLYDFWTKVALVSFLFWIVFSYRSLHVIPAGYLHSWNQITSLSFIDSIRENPSNWYLTRDVVTRVTWESPKQDIVPEDLFWRFIVFEEFPLYQLISAHIAKALDADTLVVGRSVSILLFLIGCAGLYLLMRATISGPATLIGLCLIFTSMPVIYYSSAPTSDCAMVGFLIISVYCLERFALQNNPLNKGEPLKIRWFIISCFFFMLSTLFKSYSAIWVLMLLRYLFCETDFTNRRSSLWKTYSVAILCTVLSLLPIIAWHFTTYYFLTGHAEIESHSLLAKAKYIASGELFYSLWKMFFRYLGCIFGSLILMSTVLLSKMNIKLFIPTWCKWWYISSGFFLILTADKIKDHDYYFLLLVPAVFTIASTILAEVHKKLSVMTSYRLTTVILVLLFLSNLMSSSRKLFAAQKIHDDVRPCADMLQRTTKPSDLIATLTDVSRYNSIAYIAGRKAINVEKNSFPVSRYKTAGASALLVDVDPDEFTHLNNDWLSKNGVITPYYKNKNLRDYKGKPRICALYRL